MKSLMGGISEISFPYEILLVLIPTLAGVFTSWKLTNSWQKRKDLIQVKRGLISLLDDSLHSHLTELRFFVVKVSKHYFENTNLVMDPEFEMVMYEKAKPFPKDISEQPLKKFGNQFDTMLDKEVETKKKYGRFMSDVRVYCAPLKAEVRDYFKISWKKVLSDFEKFMNSKNEKELLENYHKFVRNSFELDESLQKLRRKIISDKVIFTT